MDYILNIDEDIVNPIYKDFVFNDLDFSEYFIYGGAGSGKSYAVAQHLLFRCLSQKYFRCIYIRKIHRTIRNSQFRLFKDLINEYNLSKLFEIKESDMSIKCKINGNNLIAIGLDDPEKIKSIHNPNIAWIEEATDLNLKDYLQILTRLRVKGAKNYIISTFNPVSINHWLYNYINQNSDMFYVLNTTLDVNKFIPEEYVKNLDRMKDINPDYYNVYRNGIWGGSNTELIFSNNISTDDLNNFEFDIFGIDFGYVNPTSLIGVKFDFDNYIIYAEEFLYESRLDINELFKKIQPIVKDSLIFADSASPGMIEFLYNSGLNIYKADKNVEQGIKFLQSYDIIVDKESKNLLYELNNYKWSKDKDGRLIDKPVKINDHAIDALRYAAYTYFTKFNINQSLDIYIK